MSSALFLILAVLVVILILGYRLSYPRPLAGIPYNHISSTRISGDIPDLIAYSKQHKENGNFFLSQCRKLNSPIIQVFLRPFSTPFIILDDPREIEDILLRRTREFDRAPSTSAIFRTLFPHASIVKQSTPAFKEQRKLWMDAMTPGFLRRVVAPNIHKSALGLVDLWRAKTSLADGKCFAAQEDLKIAAFDAIWIAILGSESGGVRAEIEAVKSGEIAPSRHDGSIELPSAPPGKLYNSIIHLNHSLDKIIGSPAPAVHHWFLRQTVAFRKHNAARKHEVQRIIEQANQRFRNILEKERVGEEHDTCAMDLVLRRQLANNKKARFSTEYQNAEIEDELVMLLIAGFETTATTLGWAVKYLSHYQRQQDKLRECLRNAFESPDALRPIVTDILTAEVPYLDAFIEEVNRLANTVPFHVRASTMDTEILGHKIPKGTHIMCNAEVAGKKFDVVEQSRSSSSQAAGVKHGKNFDAEKDLHAFEPERWIGNDGNFDAYALPRLSFSLGPRACFGRKLAMQELRIMLVLLVLNFQFLPVPPPFDSLAGEQKLMRVMHSCHIMLKVL